MNNDMLLFKRENGEYIARDPTGRIKLVSDLADALLVPEIEKKKN